MHSIDNDFNCNRMINESNRDLIWIIGSLTLINFALTIYSVRMAKVLEENTTQYSTIAAVASIDNRKDSRLSMGTKMDN